MADSVTGSSSSTTTIAAGGTPGEIESATDQDWYRIPMTSGVTYTIRVAATGASASTFDPLILGIFDSNDNYVTGFNNDGLISGTYRRDAMTTYTRPLTNPVNTVDYWVAVAGDIRTVGTFTISVTSSSNTADTVTADTTTNGNVGTAGVGVTGTIDNSTDVDWYRVSLTAGATYTVRVRGLSSGGGTLADPTLVGVYNSSGTYIRNTYVDDLDTRDPVLTMVAAYTGNHYIAVDGWSDYAGTFTLDVNGAASNDVPGDTSTTATLAIGASTTARMEQAYDHDWYAVTLTAGKTYQFSMSGTGANNTPVFHGVFNAQGNYLGSYAAAILGPASAAATTIFTPTASGTYYLDAFSIYEGTYTLSAALVVDDTPANITTTATVAVDDSIVGDIGGATDIDWYRVNLTGNTTYVIRMQGRPSGNGTLDDTMISGIYNASGVVVSNTFSDDSDGNEASLTFRPATSGTYYIAADGYASYTGTYKLSVTSMPGDVGQTTANAGTVELNSPTTFTIDDASDTDWYGISLTGGVTYGIRLQGAGTKRGTLYDPVMLGIYNSTGTLVPDTYVDDARGLLNSILSFTPATSGTYYIAADGYDRFTGTGRIAVTTDDIDNTSANARLFTVGTAAEGTIDTPTDIDRYKVNLEANSVYYIRMSGFQSRSGDLADPFINGMIGPTGLAAGATVTDAVGDDIVIGLDAWYKVTTTASGATGPGMYYVIAQSSNSTDGAFLLTADKDIPAAVTGAGTITPGSSVVGFIDEKTDADWYSVTLNANTSYVIKMQGSYSGNGTIVDPYINGLRLASTPTTIISGTSGTGIDNADGRDSVVRIIPGAQNTYIINTQGSNNAFGSFLLSISTEIGNTVASAGALTVGSSVVGTIDDTTDADYYKVSLLINTSYLFKMLGADGGAGTLDDPIIQSIRTSSAPVVGAVITSVGMDSYARWVANASSDFYVEVQGAGADAGTFVLSAEIEAGNTALSSWTIETGGSVSGSIDDSTDADWYKIVVTDPSGYIFTMSGKDSSGGTITDTNIVAVRDAAGVAQGVLTATAAGSDTIAFWSPATTGTFYIDAQGAGKTGTFTLSNQTDVGSTAGSAATITVGGTAGGSIDAGTDSDYFKFTHNTSTGYLIRMSGTSSSAGTLGDPNIAEIRDSNGAALTGEVFSASGTDSLVRWAPTSATIPTTYIIDAQSGGGTTGTFVLSLETEAGNTAASAWSITVGGTASGNIDDATDSDYYKFTHNTSTGYLIRMSGTSSSAGTLGDPNIAEIRDANGAALTGEVFSASGTDSLVRWAPTSATIPTTYIIDAQSGGGTTGTFVLSLETEAGNTAASAWSITVGGTASGNIDDATDSDYYKFTHNTSTGYLIRMSGTSSSAGTLSDPNIAEIRDANGAALTGEVFSSSGTDSLVRWAPTSATIPATYIIDAQGAGTMGSFILSMETEAGGARASAWSLAINDSVSANIDDTTDTDFYQVALLNTKSYIFRMSGTSSSAGTLGDPNIAQILNTSDTPQTTGVVFSSSGTDSIVRWAPGTGGTYFLNTQGAGTIGTYVLSATTEAGPANGNAQAITLGTSVVAALDDTTDVDRYSVALTAGTRYRFRMEGVDSTGGTLTLADPWINGIRDSGGITRVAATEGGGTGRDVSLLYTPTAGGTYYIDADTSAAIIGTYRLTVELWP